MATSGVSTFSRNRDQIIKAALGKVGAVEAGETPDSDTVTDASVALNAMVKHWQATGTEMWAVSEGTLFLQDGQTQYTLSSTSTDHATESFTETTLSADAAASAATFTVTSAADLVAAQYLLIELDSGAFHGTTISTVASTTVTPAVALTGAAASGNRVFAYTTKMVRPLKILSARRYDFDSDLEIPLYEMDRLEYREQAYKTNEDSATAFFYDRRGGANASGLIHVWPQPSNVDSAIKFTWARPIQDFTTAADDQDMPQEWLEAIIYNLALRLADDYDVPDNKYVRIQKMAERLLNEVQWNERELSTVTFSPVLR